MSLKEEIDEKYPYLDDDLYTSNMTKELLAKYLDSYLHFLTYLDPSIQVNNYQVAIDLAQGFSSIFSSPILPIFKKYIPPWQKCWMNTYIAVLGSTHLT